MLLQGYHGLLDVRCFHNSVSALAKIMRPQERLIAIAYKAEASRPGSTGYIAYCTTTIRRLEHEVWRVLQHQQTPQLTIG